MKEYNCPICKGKGQYETTSVFKTETISYPAKCDYCNGSGKVCKGQLYKGKRKG